MASASFVLLCTIMWKKAARIDVVGWFIIPLLARGAELFEDEGKKWECLW
jgi:hypothetical protein